MQQKQIKTLQLGMCFLKMLISIKTSTVMGIKLFNSTNWNNTTKAK